MRFQRLFGFLFGLLLLCVALQADEAGPSNVLVGDLTFTRPTAWKWTTPDPNSPATARFMVPNEGGREGELRFYNTGKEPEGAAIGWKRYFNKEDAAGMRQETKVIGQRTITYVFLKGTLKLPGERPISGQGLVGVVIPSGKKFLHIRFSGPERVVNDSIADLKTMVESAVREREDEASGK